MRAIIATPTITAPFPQYVRALESSVAALNAAGIEHQTVYEVGCPYISHARATMLRKALDDGADCVVFIDHDMSWRPQDLVSLIKSKDDVAAGLYRFKKPEIEYMGVVCCSPDGRPVVRADGSIAGEKVPAGFLKVTRNAVRRFMRAYPELVYGDAEKPSVDLFNHGAFEGVWYGEDYAFSRRWRAIGEIAVLPDLDLTHHTKDEAYPGNFHEFLTRQPGGSNEHSA